MSHIDFLLLMKGVLIGLSIAVPVGPIAFLCIRQTVSYGFKGGIIAGLGTTIADVFYTLIITHMSHYFVSWIERYKNSIQFVGGVFFIYLAWNFYQKSEKNLILPCKKPSIYYGFVLTFILNFLSPMTTFLFLSLFMNYGILDTSLNLSASFFLAGGIGAGSFFWWTTIAFIFSIVGVLKLRINLIPILSSPNRTLITLSIYKIWPNLKNNPTLSFTILINSFASVSLLIYGVLNIFHFNE